DAVVETPRGVFVFEFKLGTCGRDGARPSPGGPTSVSAAAALAQIKAKGYAEKWLRCGKKVTLVGAAFDADMRNLSDRQVEVAADA
ncbi:MAG: PD-(D/E)XK nuclease domain-containing protein, partial [bacterium]|nr:PD-(D/E)XK nuclease domain-containing protein [bacterium]